MNALPRAHLRHLGIFVTDFDLMFGFYVRFFGFHVSDQKDFDDGQRRAWLTLDSHAHHELVISTGREAGTPSTINQISFYVEDLAAVRAYWNALENEPTITRKYGRTHGNAWSLYFWDPEDNRVEIYTDGPWHVSQPGGVNVDLTLGDEELTRLVNEYSQPRPECEPLEDYYAKMAKTLGGSVYDRS